MRFWIYQALCAVVLDQKYSNLYLRTHLADCPKKDQALATRIFYGTIQNWAYCQACWQRLVKHQPNKKVGVLLTMSVYQLLFLDKVPSYAVVNDAVSIAKKISPSSKGLVNAVLRKVQPLDLDDSISSIALRYSIPEWLMRLWIKQYGKDQAIWNAQASLHILPTYVRRNPLQVDAISFANENSIDDIGQRLPIYTGTNFAQDPLYKAGKMSAQDIGSYAIAQFVEAKAGDCILDCCSAPGTKAMAMAEMMDNEGSITCLDLHEHRVQLIEKDAKRLHLSIIHPQQADASTYSSMMYYDKVLCDVPCSGYGVLSRKPDIKLHMQPTDMDTLIPLQAAILQNASRLVRDGGILVYSTCTLNKKENEKQVQAFLKQAPDFHLIEEKTLFPNELRDGFYMAKMQYKKTLL